MHLFKITNSAVLVLLGAIPGAVLRYLFGILVPHYFNLPIGTLIANVLGSFVLGMVVIMFRLGVTTSEMVTMIGIGFCGSLTTMSSFAVESINLPLDLLLINVSITLIFVFIGAYLGRVLAIYLFFSTDN